MRRICVLLTAAVLFGWTVKGQGDRLSAGLLGGPGSSMLWGSGDTKHYTTSTGGYTIGLDLSYRFKPHWELALTPSFQQAGAAISRDFWNKGAPIPDPIAEPALVWPNYNFTNRLHYVTMPVQVRYVTKVGKLQYMVGAGPYVGLLINQQVVYKPENEYYDGDPHGVMQYKSFNLGGSLSMGFQWPATKRLSLELSLRDDLGFFNINNHTTILSGTFYTNSLYAQGGIVWGFKP